MNYVFRIILSAISIYSLLCSVRIILTWIPGMRYNGFMRFLSSLCDPFLNLFSGVRWLHFGSLDFSPILALGLLSVLAAIIQNLMYLGHISLRSIVALLISLVWSLFSSVLIFLLIFFAIRLVMLLISKGNESGSSIWSQIDYSISPFVFKISNFFSGGKRVSYKSALIISILVLIVFYFGGKYLISSLISLASYIPI